MTKHQKEDTSIPTPRYEIVDNRQAQQVYHNEPRVVEQPKQVPTNRRSDPDKEYDRPSTTIKHHQTPSRPTNTPTATEPPPSMTETEQLDPNDPDYIDKRLKQLSDEIDRKKAAKNK